MEKPKGKGPNFDIPSMTYPQPWKQLPGPPPVAPPPASRAGAPPADPLAAPAPISTGRLTWTTIAIAILIVLVCVAIGFLLR